MKDVIEKIKYLALFTIIEDSSSRLNKETNPEIYMEFIAKRSPKVL